MIHIRDAHTGAFKLTEKELRQGHFEVTSPGLHDGPASALDLARAMGAVRVLQRLKNKMTVRESK